jgi:hypothetical protein
MAAAIQTVNPTPAVDFSAATQRSDNTLLHRDMIAMFKGSTNAGFADNWLST